MTKSCLNGLVVALLTACGGASQESEVPVVVLETSKGDIRIELFAEAAPITVENFLAYVDEGFYDGLSFHRVIPGFMVQGGGFDADLVKRPPTRDPIQNESDNGLENLRGTIAMARLPPAHSATSQFFVNLVDNPQLDAGGQPGQSWGYAVFGRVIDGMGVVDEIAEVRTTQSAGMRDVPAEAVLIRRAYRADD